jgi:hypothetical protein
MGLQLAQEVGIPSFIDAPTCAFPNNHQSTSKR